MEVLRTILLFLLTQQATVVAQSTPCGDQCVDTTDGCQHKIHYMSVVNSTQSRNNGASVSTINATDASSPEKCGQQCCNEVTGLCNVAEFDPNIGQNNCIFVNCEPISACTFSHSNVVHLVTVSRPLNSVQIPSQSNTSTTPITTTEPLKTAVQNEVQESKIGSSGTMDSKNQTTLTKLNNSTKEILDNVQNDQKQSSNHLSQPSLTHQLSSEGPPMESANMSELNDIFGEVPQGDAPVTREGVTTEKTPNVLISLDVDKNKGSKGRKGVAAELGNENSEISQMSMSNETVQEETKNANNSNVKVDSNSGTIPSTSEVTTEPPTATQTDAITTTTTPINLKTTAAITTQSMLVPSSPTAFKELSFTLTVAKLPSTTRVPSILPNVTSNSTSVQDIANVTIETTKHLNSSKVEDMEEPISDIDDYKVKAKFHLVFALVLGLMLLITVMGLVLRRVYDVWLRRHYQRMDFLVDGMYNSVNS